MITKKEIKKHLTEYAIAVIYKDSLENLLKEYCEKIDVDKEKAVEAFYSAVYHFINFGGLTPKTLFKEFMKQGAEKFIEKEYHKEFTQWLKKETKKQFYKEL